MYCYLLLNQFKYYLPKIVWTSSHFTSKIRKAGLSYSTMYFEILPKHNLNIVILTGSTHCTLRMLSWPLYFSILRHNDSGIISLNAQLVIDWYRSMINYFIRTTMARKSCFQFEVIWFIICCTACSFFDWFPNHVVKLSKAISIFINFKKENKIITQVPLPAFFNFRSSDL